jgi:hypothetical protein
VDDIARAWVLLANAFPRWIIQPRTKSTWTELLADLEPPDVLAGARSLAQTCKYPQPSLADWREKAQQVRAARFRATEHAAQRAQFAEWKRRDEEQRAQA